jgi:flagellar secretion chaperone FliS
VSVPNAYQNYRKATVETASPGKLVVMLYDGAIRFLTQAKEHLLAGQAKEAHFALVRAEDIISELMSSLDVDKGGEIASNLLALYEFMFMRLVDANVRKDPAPVDEVLEFLVTLRESWQRAVAAQAEAAPGGQGLELSPGAGPGARAGGNGSGGNGVGAGGNGAARGNGGNGADLAGGPAAGAGSGAPASVAGGNGGNGATGGLARGAPRAERDAAESFPDAPPANGSGGGARHAMRFGGPPGAAPNGPSAPAEGEAAPVRASNVPGGNGGPRPEATAGSDRAQAPDAGAPAESPSQASGGNGGNGGAKPAGRSSAGLRLTRPGARAATLRAPGLPAGPAASGGADSSAAPTTAPSESEGPSGAAPGPSARQLAQFATQARLHRPVDSQQGEELRQWVRHAATASDALAEPSTPAQDAPEAQTGDARPTPRPSEGLDLRF